MKTFKKVMSIVFALLFMLSLASCTDTVDVEIKEDGSVTVYETMTLTEDELTALYENADPYTLASIPQTKQEFINQSNANGLTYSDNGVTYYGYKEQNKTISNMASLNEENLALGVGEFTKTDFWLYGVTGDNMLYTSIESLLDEVKALGLESVEMKYTVKMPYKIDKTNATKVDDYTVSFAFKDNSKIYATTEKSTAAWTKADDIVKEVINLAKEKLVLKKISIGVGYKNNKSIAVEWYFEDYLPSYMLQRKVDNGKWKTIKKSNNFAYKDKNVKAGKKYSYRVRGYVKTDDFTVYGEYSKVKSIKFANLTSSPNFTVKKGTKSATVKIKKFDKNVKGYQIQYSNSKKFKGAKKVLTKKATKEIKKLKSGKTYYVRVRKYCLDDMAEKVFGNFSKTKSVKVK